MSQTTQLKELSFLVYGLGLSGLSVIKFFKKNKIKNFTIWDDNKKNQFKKLRARNLNKTLKKLLRYIAEQQSKTILIQSII